MSTTTRRRFTENAAHDLKARTRQETSSGPAASDKQITFIETLLVERDLTDEQRSAARVKLEAGLSKDTASAWITKLLDKPKVARAARPVKDEPDAGMYRRGEDIVRVYLGQRSGKMLLKRLVDHGDGDHSYEYEGQAAYKLGDAVKLTLEEAKAFGRMSGTCCVCARRLDDPESVEAGIGPVCATRFDA